MGKRMIGIIAAASAVVLGVGAPASAAGTAPEPAPGAAAEAEPILHYPLTSDFANAGSATGFGDAEPRNGAALTDGVGVRLDGANDYIELPDDVLAGLDAVSVSMEIYLEPSQATPYFIWTLGVSDSAGYLFTTGDPYRTSITTSNWSGEQTTSAGSALPRGRWVTITYTQNAAGTSTLYEDGVEVARRTGVTIAPGDLGGGATPNNFIGRSQYSGDRYLAATVREFQLWDEALEASDLESVRLEAAASRLDLGRTTGLTSNLTLPAASGDVPVMWSTSDPAVIDDAGRITVSDVTGVATLTATLAGENATVVRDFEVTVAAASGLAEVYGSQFVLEPVLASGSALPALPNGVGLVYSSDSPEVAISAAGVLTSASAEAVEARVTAEITAGSSSVVKTFAVRVLPADDAHRLLGYERAPLARQVYSASIAHSLHLALAGSGEQFTALHDNTGVAFAEGIQVADHLHDTTTIRSPWVFHREGGGYGVLGVLGDAAGSPRPDYAGRLVYLESDDLLQYRQVGYLTVGEETALSPRAVWDSAQSRYVISWATASGAWRTGFTDSVLDSVTGGTPLETTVDRAPLSAPLPDASGIAGALPGNVITIDGSTAGALETRFGRIVNTSVDFDDEVTTAAGTSIDLDAAVATLGYSDGSEVEYPIEWDAAQRDAVDFDTPGRYPVTGQLRDERNIFPLARQRADPTAIYWEGRYVAVSTWDVNNANSAGIPLRVSDTIAGLATAPEVRIVTNTQTATDGTRMVGCFWAPDILEVNGQLQIFFAPCYGRALWSNVVSTVVKLDLGGDPANPADWGQPQKVLKADGSPLQLSAAAPGISLDMTYYRDTESGVEYVVWSERYINSPHPGGSGTGNGDAELWIAEYDDATMRLSSDPVLINSATASWEQNTGDVVEAPFFAVKDGTIWMTYSASNVDATYAVGLMQAEVGADLLDPASWLEWNAPVVKSDPERDEYGPGHNGFFEDEHGDLYFIYHSKSTVTGSRDAGIRRVFWASDGQPVLDMTDDERIAPQFREVTVTVVVEEATVSLEVGAVASVRCVAGRAVVVATVTNSSEVPVDVSLDGAFGERRLDVLEPGRSASQVWSTRTASIGAGAVTVSASGEVAGAPVATSVEAGYPERTCG